MKDERGSGGLRHFLAAAIVVGAVAVLVSLSLRFLGSPGVTSSLRLAGGLPGALRRGVRLQVFGARLYGGRLLVLDLSIENGSNVVVMCSDLRVVGRGDLVYYPSRSGSYYVNQSEALWMRQVDPGSQVRGRLAFDVGSIRRGLWVGIECPREIVRLGDVGPLQSITTNPGSGDGPGWP